MATLDFAFLTLYRVTIESRVVKEFTRMTNWYRESFFLWIFVWSHIFLNVIFWLLLQLACYYQTKDNFPSLLYEKSMLVWKQNIDWHYVFCLTIDCPTNFFPTALTPTFTTIPTNMLVLTIKITIPVKLRWNLCSKSQGPLQMVWSG